MKTIYKTCIILLFINGFLALLGGIPMVMDPSGSLNQLPLDWLKGSPFPDYLIPGIYLSFAIGIFSIITAYASLLHHRFAPNMTIAVGIMLMVWIIVQMNVIPIFSLLQPGFLLIGIVLMMLGFIQRRLSVFG